MDHKSGYITLENMSQATWYNRWSFKKFSEYLQGDILEVGCGIGNFTKALSKFGKVWAIDNDHFCVEKTKKQTDLPEQVLDANIETDSHIFGKKKFDTIVCLNVLEHIKKDRRALINMYQKLKIHGNLVLLVPIHPSLYGEIDRSINHYRRYRPNELKTLLSNCHFEIIFSRKLNFLGALGWWFSGKVLKNNTVHKKRLLIFDLIAPFILPLEDIIEPPIGTSLLVIAQK